MKAVKGGKDAGSNIPRGENNLHRSVEGEASKQGTHEKSNINYSERLLQLIHPYRKHPEDEEHLHHLLGLGVIAWNMTAMKGLAPEAFTAMKEETREEFNADEESYSVIEKMLVDLDRNIAQITMFIRDYDVEGSEEKVQVKVSMLSFDEFMVEGASSFTDEEDMEIDLADKDDGYVNRNGISILPKQPLLDWLNNKTPAFPVALPPDGTVYLVGEMDSREEIQKWLEKNFDQLFTLELDSWHSDPSDWPQHRTYKMFNEWFSVGINTMVYDMSGLPLEKG